MAQQIPTDSFNEFSTNNDAVLNDRAHSGEEKTKEISMSDKYLTFRLGGEHYGFCISKVQEIIKMQRITKVPRTASHVRGVINLRGKVIPVVDVALKLNIRADAYTSDTCIVIVQAESTNLNIVIGIIVDSVSEVQNISVNQIDPPPALCTSDSVEGELSNFISGIARVGDTVISLLDINSALKSDIEQATE